MFDSHYLKVITLHASSMITIGRAPCDEERANYLKWHFILLGSHVWTKITTTEIRKHASCNKCAFHNSTKQDTSWDTDGCSSGQGTLCLSWNKKVYYFAHKRHLSVSTSVAWSNLVKYFASQNMNWGWNWKPWLGYVILLFWLMKL
jgi:hypothetical protein